MQQIYLGWDIMDEYHNIIDHYQGYYYLHSLFQNTAQVKTFQSENSSCFEFSNPAKKGRLENPSGKKSQNGIFAKLGYLGVVTRCSATSLRYGLEIQRTKCGKHLPSSEEKKKCGRVWGISKDIDKCKKKYWKILKLLDKDSVGWVAKPKSTLVLAAKPEIWRKQL